MNSRRGRHFLRTGDDFSISEVPKITRVGIELLFDWLISRRVACGPTPLGEMEPVTRVIRSRALDQPLDLAPVHIDTTHPDHASNTTMQPGRDFYVANRGNDTIVRMRQDGTVVAVRKVRVGNRSLGQAHLNGIATSSDGSKIWVTYVGKLPGSRDRHGGVLELPAF